MFNNDILFSGWYGHYNTGDDAFIEVSSWGAKRYWGKYNNLFLSKKEKLPLMLSSINGYPFSIPKSYHIQNVLLLQNTRYLISAGGSILSSKMDARDIKSMAVKRKVKNKEFKLGGIGVSIGPFKTKEDERAIFEYLKHLDFLAVRDQASYDIVSQLDLPYQPVNAFDLAALLPKVYSDTRPIVQRLERKVIGVSVCSFESITDPKNIANEQKRNNMLCELLQSIDAQDDVHFKFLVINGNERVGDFLLTYKTIQQSKLKNVEVVPYQRETKSMWHEIKSCDFVISTRLHAAIFACFADVPFMLNEYHRKCGDFLETVGYHNSYRLYDSEYCIKQTTKKILDILNKCNYKAPRLKDLAVKRSELNFTKVYL